MIEANQGESTMVLCVFFFLFLFNFCCIYILLSCTGIFWRKCDWVVVCLIC